MPQFTATSRSWLWIENRFLNGPASQLPASWNHLTISFGLLASRTISRIATTRIPTATAVAARTTPARNSISLPPCWRGATRRRYSSDGNYRVAFPRTFYRLFGGHLQPAAQHRAGLARVDDVVDQRVAGGDVD